MGVIAFMVHVHKKHGFFIPDVKYLKDPKSFLAYLGLKVNRYYMCLYCNDGCHPFGSLEVVQKHMEAENHCKVHYDDGCDNDRYLIRLLGDALLHYIYDYMYQNILTDRLACMALATNLGFENTSFRNPPSQLLDVLLDVQVGKDAYKTNSFDKCAGNWRSNTQMTRRC